MTNPMSLPYNEVRYVDLGDAGTLQLMIRPKSEGDLSADVLHALKENGFDKKQDFVYDRLKSVVKAGFTVTVSKGRDRLLIHHPELSKAVGVAQISLNAARVDVAVTPSQAKSKRKLFSKTSMSATGYGAHTYLNDEDITGTRLVKLLQFAAEKMR